MAHHREEIVRVLKAAQNVLLITHVHPDGDALGSQIAMANILEAAGKNVFMYGEDPVSHLYDFLPLCDKIENMLPDLRGFDCAIALDCGDSFRMGHAKDDFLTVHPFLVVDHHAGHKDFGDLRWVAPGMSSTGEMVFELAADLGYDIPYEAAYCLYAAIVSDTGSFKYSSTTADTFRIAGELVAKGVKPASVAGKLFDNFSVNRLHLMRLVLDSLELYADERLAIIWASREMFRQTSTTQADAESFINYPRSVQSVKVAAFIKETEKGMIAVSMRSKGTNYDVAQIAAFFGGGGHRNAAGFKLPDTDIDKVRELLLGKVLPMVQN
ncbi:MAG: bifunctional oligoribonuclease/PAP phosphatase NrnA [Desulfobulbaceae bacterium]|nr:bifunctional oligoribonuclease/PAP phosphatase NrnA [Desulfobulbaceae bacterium]HIJ77708.1 bifunctional oligoribonuclease/PAP phosphatase NrnA [Deltaproteobacteria bacterium]